MTWLGANIIETASGQGYDFLNPDPAVINIDDIAHALGNICRFAGHTRKFYSVAEHSVLVSEILEHNDNPDAPIIGLLHDAHEAYVWDAPRPIKPLLGEAFATLAEIADRAIGEHFGIDPWLFHSAAVKTADNLALVNEGRSLMKVGPKYDQLEYQPLPTGVRFWGGLPPAAAKGLFLARAEKLGVIK